jgi:sec-independent protein translocase protein TatB
MFGLSFTEVLIIAVLALVLLGPDQLPSAAKTLGKALRELKRATDDLKGQFEGEMQGLELDAERPQRPTLVPAAPVPGAVGSPPQASFENVPGLEAARVELAPAPAAEAPLTPRTPAFS